MTENSKSLSWGNSARCKKTQMGSSMSSGIKAMNRRSISPKDKTVKKKKNETEILELQNSNEKNKASESTGNTADRMEARTETWPWCTWKRTENEERKRTKESYQNLLPVLERAAGGRHVSQKREEGAVPPLTGENSQTRGGAGRAATKSS